ncbi:hypothetical protein GUITHDRAFT_146856 [Guillardia theta CCMP2712]|uniref:Uncharacterized protein n=1 Tax=Guillardia theta (strain CCMP2712) TaxID=905079 RepID=L1IFD8_GUITC|nr:hypothetical protein GUITHDRAFT_146856 [Guillardia theta CCMP2712]EKX34948.1 hypothetical protein GUITHDRAFT_146856 [Guillardia theta CCMP2712]|eukprot:XP_005821928.1 hypothetical protein GUITHDRAFT_146856 [Guillardia theta CCMP2712]
MSSIYNKCGHGTCAIVGFCVKLWTQQHPRSRNVEHGAAGKEEEGLRGSRRVDDAGGERRERRQPAFSELRAGGSAIIKIECILIDSNRPAFLARRFFLRHSAFTRVDREMCSKVQVVSDGSMVLGNIKHASAKLPRASLDDKLDAIRAVSPEEVSCRP